MKQASWRIALACGALALSVSAGAAGPAGTTGTYPTVPLSSIPDALQQQYLKVKPEMSQYSHCAAAFDSSTDGEKMTFRCSIYVRMSAEGERRAMRYCEEKRAEHKINAPCKLIVEP